MGGVTGSAAESKYAVRVVLAPEGHEPDPARLAALPSTLMSDTLVELMAPYIFWPPAPDEIGELAAWLELGAAIWNVTVEARDGAECARGLARVAGELDDEDPLGLVAAIARRKFARFPHDRRRVTAVRVILKDGRAWVEAATVTSMPGRRL